MRISPTVLLLITDSHDLRPHGGLSFAVSARRCLTFMSPLAAACFSLHPM